MLALPLPMGVLWLDNVTRRSLVRSGHELPGVRASRLMVAVPQTMLGRAVPQSSRSYASGPSRALAEGRLFSG